MRSTVLNRMPLLAAAVALLLSAGVYAADEHKDKKEKKDAYPLKTCVVSGEKLGSMGDPYVIQHEGREVRLCCKGCEKTFNEDPEKYLKKLDEAAKKPEKAGKAEKKAEKAKDDHAGHDH